MVFLRVWRWRFWTRLGLPWWTAVAVGLAADLGNPRVGPGQFLGEDPLELPADRRAQAEPHLARSPLDPDWLLATFQEGRFTDGGAVSCGYSLSTNGGLTWSRALIPQLTKISGGIFDRASDPVAAFDLAGNAYLNTLGLIGANNQLGVLLLSRSTNSGATFGPPVEIFRPASTAVFPDKNWIAINTFPGTTHFGRLAVTFTRFSGSVNPLAITTSDDQGSSWSEPTLLTPANSRCQGTQPVWLPDGVLVIVYWNFGDLGTLADDAVECVRSVDGGRTFGSTRSINAAVQYYDAPTVRDGAFLPSASVSRVSGELFVTYQGMDAQRLPRVWVQRSADGGQSWSNPLAVSDNVQPNPDGLPASPPVSLGESFNPAIDVAPDGRRVVVAYFDSRVRGLPYVDTFALESLDGGRTWGAGLRLTGQSTDVRLAPLTPGGHMLGDYLGVVAPVDDDTPAVVATVSEQSGGMDPLAVRWGVAEGLTFSSWRAARWSHRDILDPQVATAESDADGDGWTLRREYEHGLDPFAVDPADAAMLRGGRLGLGEISLEYSFQSAAVDLKYSLEVQDDAGGWSRSSLEVVLDTRGGRAVARRSLPTTLGRGFYRLRVEQVVP